MHITNREMCTFYKSSHCFYHSIVRLDNLYGALCDFSFARKVVPVCSSFRFYVYGDAQLCAVVFVTLTVVSFPSHFIFGFMLKSTVDKRKHCSNSVSASNAPSTGYLYV